MSEPVLSLEDFRLEARTWLAAQDQPRPATNADERFEQLRAWQRRLYDGGWIGLTWPKESGGRGLPPVYQAIFNSELSRARAPRPAGVVGLEVVGPTIVRFGTEAQRRERLPRVLSGEDIWCQGFSEPEAGSDLASLRTSATRTEAGWLINGHKVWTTWGHKANWCALLARTDPSVGSHRGISYFLIPMSLPGISVRPLRQLNGDAEFGEVIFDNVTISTDSLVGELNQGWSYAMHTLSSERGSLVLRKAADLSVAMHDLISELVTGGSAITQEEVRRIGELEVDRVALDAQCVRTVRRLTEASNEPSVEDSLDKNFLTRFEQNLFSFARDLLGPYAHVHGSSHRGLDSTRWSHDYFFSRAATIYGGTAQVQRNLISERLLGLPREVRP